MHVVCTFAWVVVSINGAALPEGGELDGETLMTKGDDKATLSGGKLVMPTHDLPSRDGPKMNVMPRLLAHINMQTRAHFCMAVCVRACAMHATKQASLPASVQMRLPAGRREDQGPEIKT